MSSTVHLTVDPRDGARMAYGLNIRAMALGTDRDISGPERTYIEEMSNEFKTVFGSAAIPGAGPVGSLAWLQALLSRLRQDDRTLPIFENEDRIVNVDAAMAYAMIRIRTAMFYETNTRNTDLKNHIYLAGRNGAENIHLTDRRESDLERGGPAEAAELAAARRYRDLYDRIDPDPDVERGFKNEEAGRSRKLSFKDMISEMDGYESNMRSGKLHYDSRLYRNITDALKKVNDNWDKNPADHIDEMLKVYDELGDACRRYIREREGAVTKLGRHRLSVVSDILRMQAQERRALILYKNRMERDNLPEEGKKPTLLDIATEARTVRIPADAPVVGGAMSARYQIKEGPDQGFFTENKPFQKTLKDNYLAQLNAEAGIPQEIKDAVAQALDKAELFEEFEYARNGEEFMDFLRRHDQISENSTPEEMAAWQGLADEIDSYLSDRVPRSIAHLDLLGMLDHHTDLPEAGKAFLVSTTRASAWSYNLRLPLDPKAVNSRAPGNNLVYFIPESQRGNKRLVETCVNFQNNYHKLTSNEFTTRWLAGVPSESLPRLNERSIATSVMAGLLGCPDLVAQAQKARTGTGADAKDGLFMETAGGINGNSLRTKLKESDWKTRGCAPNVKRQLADMQILDLICGQCDRHANNIMWETDANGYPISIKGIDHDMSFGVFDVEARGESASHLGLVRVVDQKTYEFVENLAKPENRALIEYKFKDLLGEKEIDALWGRIDTMARKRG